MRGLGLFSLLGHFTDKTISWKNMILQNVCGLKASEKQKSWEQSRRRRLWFSFRLHHMIFLRTSSSAPLRLPANIIKKSLKCSENGDLDIYVSMATGQTSSAQKHPAMWLKAQKQLKVVTPSVDTLQSLLLLFLYFLLYTFLMWCSFIAIYTCCLLHKTTNTPLLPVYLTNITFCNHICVILNDIILWTNAICSHS